MTSSIRATSQKESLEDRVSKVWIEFTGASTVWNEIGLQEYDLCFLLVVVFPLQHDVKSVHGSRLGIWGQSSWGLVSDDHFQHPYDGIVYLPLHIVPLDLGVKLLELFDELVRTDLKIDD